MEEKAFLEEVKKEFGLVPAKGETLANFELRVQNTVYHKAKPFQGFLNAIMSKNLQRNRSTTFEVQSITEKYLGIRHPPFDSFESSSRGIYEGFTLEEEDGSAVIVTVDKPDNTETIIDTTAKSLEKIIKGEKIELSEDASMRLLRYRAAGLDYNDEYSQLFFQVFELLMQNETFVKLHEAIHAIHINNHPLGLRKKKSRPNIRNLEAIISILPVIGPVLKFKKYNFAIESECLTYKVGTETFFADVLEKAAHLARNKYSAKINPDMLDQIKVKLSEINSKFVEYHVKKGYLYAPIKGYGTIKSNMTNASLKFAGSAILFGSDNWFVQTMWAFLLIGAIDNVVKLPFSLYLSRKTKSCVETVDATARKCGSAAKAFYETLGMSFSQMRQEAKDYLRTINYF